MLREIKFRGKSVDTGEWVFGSLFMNQSGTCYILDTNNDGDNGTECRFTLVDHKTVCQFIGLRDINGKEIYEKDLAKRKGMRPIWVVQYVGHTASFGIASTDYCQDMYGRVLRGSAQLFLNDWKDCEVVGNIWDNPELLKTEP